MRIKQGLLAKNRALLRTSTSSNHLNLAWAAPLLQFQQMSVTHLRGCMKLRGVLAFFLLGLIGLVACQPPKSRDTGISLAQSTSTGCSNCSSPDRVEGAYSKLVRACVENLCPDAEFSQSKVLDKIGERFKDKESGYDRDLGPFVKEITQTKSATDIASAQALKEWIKNPPNIQNPSEIRIYNLFKFLRTFEKFKARAQNGRVIIDLAASRANFSTLNDAEFDHQLKIAKRVYSIFGKPIFEGTTQREIALRYSGDQLKVQIEKAISETLANAAKVAAHPDLQFLMQLPDIHELARPEHWQDIKNNPQVNPTELQKLSSAHSAMAIFDFLGKDAELKALLTTDRLDLDKDAQESGVAQKLQRLIETRKAQANGPDQDIKGACRLSYVRALEVLPSAQDLEAFRPRIETLKQQFITKSRQFLSAEDAQKIETRLAQATIALPITRDRHLANLKQSLEKGVESARQSKNEMETIQHSDHRDIFMALMMAQTPDVTKDKSSTEDICEHLQVQLLPDAALSNGNRILIGPMVVRFGKQADGIFFHELGHLLFSELSNHASRQETETWFTQAQRCLIGNHSEMPAEEQHRQAQNPAQALYVSEDWADLISAQIDEPANNFACFFVRQANDEDYDGFLMKNEDLTDPHSSDFYRLLHLSSLKQGQLSAACLGALAAKDAQPHFRNCIGTH